MKLFAIIATLVGLVAVAGTIEVPLAINHVYMRRLPGNYEFFFVGRLPHAALPLIAIPESEIGRFIQLAEENGFNEPGLHTLLPKEAAIKQVAKATITVEETDQFQFYRSDVGLWIKWNEEDPPTVKLDGEEVTTFGWIEIPLSPTTAIGVP